MIQDGIQISTLNNTPGKMELNLFFLPECSYFRGHFPDFPLLPGVIQADLAIELFEEYQRCKLPFKGFKQIKFFSPIFPGSLVKLECSLSENKRSLNFHFSKDGELFSSGVVRVDVDV